VSESLAAPGPGPAVMVTFLLKQTDLLPFGGQAVILSVFIF
jgi:hypothetical protein